MKHIKLTLLLLLLPALAMAQINLTGTVVDAQSGEPLVGVSVSSPKNSTGTITDIDGRFSLTLQQADLVSFSYIGYDTERQKVSASTTLNIRMQETSQTIDEVVVVGAAMKKSDLTGSVGSISADQIKEVPTANLNQALQGKVPGVYIESNPKPGANASIQIRGNNSISYGTTPLYVIDNIMIDDTDISTINPNDIASIEILKDASATALYGARGANGVVVITTRRGQKGKGRVTYDGWVGWQTFANNIPVMDGPQTFDYRVDSYANKYIDQNPTADRNKYIERYLLIDGKRINQNVAFASWEMDAYKEGLTYNWVNEITRPGFQHNHNVTFSGATDHVNYFTSFGYSNQKGQIVGSAYHRYNGKVNLEFDVNKWLKIGTNNSLAYSVENPMADDNMYLVAFRADPLYYINDEQYYMWEGKLESQSFHNPIKAMNTITRDVDKFRYLTSNYIDIHPVKGLNIRSTFSLDFAQQENDYYFNTQSTTSYQNAYDGYAQQYRTKSLNWQWDNTVSYNATIAEKHRIGAVVGMDMSYYSNNWNQINAVGFGNDLFGYKNIGAATNKEQSSWSSSWTSYSLMSAYLRANYVYDSRYYITFTGRADGSSKFGPSHKWGFFPSVAASWNITGEQFMKDQNVVDNLRLRLGYGLVGNQNIPNYGYNTIFSTRTTLETFVFVNNGMARGGSNGTYGNPDLRWETQKQLNVGLDMAFWHNRIQMTLDYFYTKNEDLLMQRSLAGTYGYSYMLDNVGCLLNQGAEFKFDLNAVKTKDWEWNIGFNVATARNKITALYGDVDKIYNVSGNSVQRTGNLFLGESLNNIYVYQFDKIAQEEDMEYVATLDLGGRKVRPGDILPVDRNGDKVIDDGDRYIIGNTDPKFYGGIHTELSWRGLSLQIVATYSFGARRISNLYETLMQTNGATTTHADNLNRWTPENTNTDINRAYWGSDRFSMSMVDHGIQDASFLKISAMTLSYTFPKEWMQRIYFDNARIYFTANNPFTFTKYKGYDPESGDYYPSSRMYVVGLNIGF
ncbi:MAG: TonB-dependent receptor [Paludibacteraceae bacterium]|nr:TonB-dependent receptor [Paludibacteraceae bacterium]